MTFVSWAAFFEGSSDALYYEVLLPRLMEDIISKCGIGHSDIPTTPVVRLGTNGREVTNVADEICRDRDAFVLVFIHADTGGRGLERGIDARSSSYCEAASARCAWPVIRCVTITPRHETEAWVLADAVAVADALGFKGELARLELPDCAAAAERLADPKATLEATIRKVFGKRSRAYSVERLLPAIAQRQSISELRKSPSFAVFETGLRAALADIGCIPRGL